MSWTISEEEFIQKVFQRYGDGKTMSLKGFEELLREIKLENLIPHHHNHHQVTHPNTSAFSNLTRHDNEQAACLSSETLLNGSATLTPSAYKNVCPVLLTQLLPSLKYSVTPCTHTDDHTSPQVPYDTKAVWLYSTLSIIVISLCGLLGVAVIPVMQKVFYQQLIQFLVALAVGTLCGDALLHLLPHAMGSHSHTHDDSAHSEDNHDVNIWRGLVAMLGVVFFYFTEKCLTMVSEWWKRRQRKTQMMPRVRVMRDDESPTSRVKVGEKLCKHKYSSYPYCYGEITDNPADTHTKGEELPGTEVNDCKDKNVPPAMLNGVGGGGDNLGPHAGPGNSHIGQKRGQDQEQEPGTQSSLLGGGDIQQADDDRYTVIIREHNNAHHGHSHTHGHVHSAPQSMSSVAWMVIMGDGLHNFTDGMAIGAAFAANIAGGFSTSVAVFCHELPHELGDFAVLLKAGMSARDAVFYNVLSSVLCFFGMCFGIFLGHDEHMYQWVFAAAAGMFLYIALVDMIPELTTSHSNEGGSLFQCLLHFTGLMLGIGIMLLIAIYEHDLKTVFHD